MGLASRFRSAVQLDPREAEKTYRFVENGVTNVVWLQDRETLRERVALETDQRTKTTSHR